MDIYKNDLLYWVWLTVAFGPAQPRKWAMCSRYGSARECCEAVERGSLDGLSPDERRSVSSATLEQARNILEYCDERSILVYGYDSEGYPPQLRDIYNPPSVLFSLGDLSFLSDSLTLGIVGARKITEYTERVTDTISRQLVKSGVVIISGLAEGVDTAAHIGAIEGGGRTVAVLGNGLEHEFPKGSDALKKRISENGAVISEYFPQSRPNGNSFKARNRILSGLSKGVLITQASKKSGALNTASNALQQGRDLFCIPPADIFAPEYAGVAELIRDGAIPVFSHNNILYEYYAEYPHKLRFTKDPDAFVDLSQGSMFFAADIPVEEKKPSKKSRSETKDLAEDEKNTGIAAKAERKQTDTSKLSGEQKRIVEVLEDFSLPAAADEIADRLGIDVSDLFTELTSLEMEGYVRGLAGNRFELI